MHLGTSVIIAVNPVMLANGTRSLRRRKERKMKASEIKLVMCETIPDELESGKLYYSEKYRTATHLCACGCGNKVVTPCKRGFWSIDTKDGKPTLSPSIGSFNLPCDYHYLIKQGKVVWL